MTLSPHVIRQRVAEAISDAMESDGWREATGLFDTFGQGDGEGRLHLGFAVGVPETRFKEGRQRQTSGALCETTVGVKWAFQIAAMDQVASYDAAKILEGRIVAAVAGVQHTPDVSMVFVSMSASVDDQGWMMGEQTWTALHLLPLV